MSSIGHDDIAYYQEIVDHLRARLKEGGDPSDWSDGDKLRLIAALFDEADIMRGVIDQHELQDDLRRMADKLEVRPETLEAMARLFASMDGFNFDDFTSSYQQGWLDKAEALWRVALGNTDG